MLTFDEITRINAEVNKVPFMRGMLGDTWDQATTDFMGMLSGANCNSYATAKMQKLYQAGQPIDTLRLMMCNHPNDPRGPLPEGNHVCLLADCDGETYILCNTLPEPTLMERVPYEWKRIQVAGTPDWEFA